MPGCTRPERTSSRAVRPTLGTWWSPTPGTTGWPNTLPADRWSGRRTHPQVANEGNLAPCGANPGYPQFEQPRDVGVDASGNVYVADNGNGRVVVLNGADGKCLIPPFRLHGGAPIGVTVSATPSGQRVYVANAPKNDIMVFDTSGTLVEHDHLERVVHDQPRARCRSQLLGRCLRRQLHEQRRARVRSQRGVPQHVRIQGQRQRAVQESLRRGNRDRSVHQRRPPR